MAGFIDSDGSIYIAKSHDSTRTYYRVFLTVTNASREICEWFMAHTSSGGVYKSNYKSRSAKHAEVYRWVCQRADDVEEVLGLLLPVLKVKHNRAEVALNLLSLRGLRPSLEVDAKREYLFTQMKDLNRRGPK